MFINYIMNMYKIKIYGYKDLLEIGWIHFKFFIEVHKYKYILVIIDVYSRFVQAVGMTNRTLETITKNVREICDHIGWPKNLNCDNEFNKASFIEMMEKHDVTLYFSQPGEINKNAIVERFNRTLAGMLQKYRTAKKKYDWNNWLPAIIKNYNQSYHKTLKAAPVDVFSGNEGNNENIRKQKGMKVKVGDLVRVKIEKKVFDKGDINTYSKQIYEVTKVVGQKVHLRNNETGADVTRTYKPYEISKITSVETVPQDEEEEKVHVATKKHKKARKVLKELDTDLVETKIYSKRSKAPSKRLVATIV
jgi:hypothetical protein